MQIIQAVKEYKEELIKAQDEKEQPAKLVRKVTVKKGQFAKKSLDSSIHKYLINLKSKIK